MNPPDKNPDTSRINRIDDDGELYDGESSNRAVPSLFLNPTVQQASSNNQLPSISFLGAILAQNNERAQAPPAFQGNQMNAVASIEPSQATSSNLAQAGFLHHLLAQQEQRNQLLRTAQLNQLRNSVTSNESSSSALTNFLRQRNMGPQSTLEAASAVPDTLHAGLGARSQSTMDVIENTMNNIIRPTQRLPVVSSNVGLTPMNFPNTQICNTASSSLGHQGSLKRLVPSRACTQMEDIKPAPQLETNFPPTAQKGHPTEFPKKLYQMLLDLEAQPDGTSIASFLPHGRSFAIYKQKEFILNVVPKYFRMSCFASFKRQLNMYNFQQILSGPDKGAYHHELFIRGQPHLFAGIKRIKKKQTSKKQELSE